MTAIIGLLIAFWAALAMLTYGALAESLAWAKAGFALGAMILLAVGMGCIVALILSGRPRV